MTSIQTTCPYCGVGCGINAQVNELAHQLVIKGDNTHPANFGKLCSKGYALGDTVTLKGRLIEPKIYGQTSNWATALDLVAQRFKHTIENYGANAVAIYGSGQLLTEDYFVANKLMKGFIGSANIDTNSRLCMSSSVSGHKRAFGTDTVPGCYEDIELADMIVLIGSNAAWCHPVIFQRIRAAKDRNPDLKIVVIDPRKTASCDIADLHLPIASGADAFLFNGLLQFLYQRGSLNTAYIENHTEGFSQALQSTQQLTIQEVATLCALPEETVHCFYSWFADHEKVISMYSQGINQSSSGTDKVNAIINCHLATGRIGKPGMGPLSLTGQPNAMGGREVGGLANQLAAHMDFSNPVDIDRVARFWHTDNIARTPGYSATELFDAIYDGKIKAVWIMGTNPVVSLPNADKVKQALQRCDFVVVSDCIANTDTTALAHVLLPAQGWSEKDGTVTNSERRISRQRALFKPAGLAKPDWWMITQVARRMGFTQSFPYEQPSDIFREHAALSGFENDGQRDFDISALATITAYDYEQLAPVQWPINSNQPKGAQRLFSAGTFFTVSGKAQFVTINPQLPINAPNNDYPLVLNTGRLRDQWHTMTRTALATQLNQHRSEPFVEVHPADAEHYSLLNNGLAEIASQWGRMLARVTITEAQQPGHLFIPMHWTEQYARQSRVGALVNPVIDPLSKQPESKHTPVHISAFPVAWYGFLLSREEISLPDIDYWVKINTAYGYHYLLAGKTTPEDCLDEWQKILCVNKQAIYSGQTYQDKNKDDYRMAQFIDNQLDSVLFINSQNTLPGTQWLAGLFAKTELSSTERKFLLRGCALTNMPEEGEIICVCFNVGAKAIDRAIKEHGCKTHQEVGQCLKAGTNCGSCVPEIKALLASA